jgi:hypothetical protein
MGFSGGGSNVLLPHTHDGTVSQDGGPLDFNNITQSQSAAGEVFYSDGAHLQQLAYPGVPAGETLTAVAASSAPSWAAAAPASSTYALVASSTLGAAATEIDITFASIDCDDISELMCVFVGGMDSSSYVQMQINSLTTSYYTFGTHSNNGSSINIYTANTSAWTLCSNNAGGDWKAGTSTFHLRGGTSTASPTSSSNASYSGQGSDMLPNACWFLGGSQNSTVNSFDQVRVFANSGNLTAGSKLTIYRINST